MVVNGKFHQPWMEEETERFVYILMLREYKFYVGQSKSPEERIKKQFKGKGSAWTKLYRPVEVVFKTSIGTLDYKEAEYYENMLTLKYMKKYGWENVRGGFFTHCDKERVLKALLSHKQKGTFQIDFV